MSFGMLFNSNQFVSDYTTRKSSFKMILKNNIYIVLALCMIVGLTNAKNVELPTPINQFATEFYLKMSDSNPNESMIMSPLSAQIALGLLSAGATGNTRKQITNAVHMENTDIMKSAFGRKLIKNDDTDGITLNIVNKIYIKDGEFYSLQLEPTFKKIAEDSFDSKIENINFSAREQAASAINDWVENQTNHKIKDLISKDSLNDNTRAVLINAIYFMGNWKIPFNKQFSWSQKFHVSDSETISVEMMSHMKEHFPYVESKELDSQILSLPYKSSNSSLVIVLPKKRNNLKSLEEKLINTDIKSILKDMKVWEIDVTIPKFNVSTTIDLKNILPKLGIDMIFDPNMAELDGILKNKERLFISEAIQKAFIEVNEHGTEAAAATAMMAMAVSMPMYRFVADHPFLYAVVYEGDIIFCGKYLGK